VKENLGDSLAVFVPISALAGFEKANEGFEVGLATLLDACGRLVALTAGFTTSLTFPGLKLSHATHCSAASSFL